MRTRELDQLRMVFTDAADVAHRLVQQSGIVLIGAGVDVERKLRPGLRGKAFVGFALGQTVAR